MSESDLDALRHRVRPADGDPEGALVLLHGRGADENDLVPLFDLLDPDRRLVAVTPRGPLSLPPGGAHWYQLGGIPTPEPDSFNDTFPTLSAWVDAFAEANGVGIERTVIGGFSQGGVMSCALSLSATRPRPAGLIVFSAFLPRAPGLDFELAGRSSMPVAVSHGSLDPIIPVERGRELRAELEGAGFDVVYGEFPMGHAIDPGFARELGPWVQKALDAVDDGR